eukprot:TRINITY_DN782264_c0_g1_i1.p1 TRINITY_DN782264_c0_g1~~TRINITY_DN782264_c0_g1_i1.p1  ORF type:complete len:209 (-),score=26.79 TRINITY_DN782264_c0_g1_i1:171-797(-)
MLNQYSNSQPNVEMVSMKRFQLTISASSLVLLPLFTLISRGVEGTLTSFVVFLWTIHFGRMFFESFFIHPSLEKAKAEMLFDVAFFGGFAFWFSFSDLRDVDLIWRVLGVNIFLISQVAIGLSNKELRKRYHGDAPTGPLFSLVTCPQYTFEIIAWFGLNICTQTFTGLVFMAVDGWNLVKFSEYEHNNLTRQFIWLGDRKRIIPFFI